MKWLDPRSIYSEVELIIEEMEKCQSDQMAYVKGAAYEASQTAKKIAQEEGSKFENSCGSVTGLNFVRRDHNRRRNIGATSDESAATASPESQTLDSFMKYDSFLESPISMTQVSCNLEQDQRSVNRRLWRYENGGVDVSLKDGLFSAVAQGGSVCDSPTDLRCNHGTEFTEEFSGFLNGSPENVLPRSSTPSPQMSRSRINVDNFFTTPRRLIRSLQDPNDLNSDYPGKRYSRMTDHNSYQRARSYTDGESVSSTDDSPAELDVEGANGANPVNKKGTLEFQNERIRKKTAYKMFFGLFFIIIVALTSLWTEVEDESFYIVPT
ncbi:putative NDH-dependent cyclic electron flow 5 [Hibiscus syriacus]|uniref:NDH-dependent cyclic electron flow 5 n=1 Tax=Hibiscus syriacus TaxID=106335 RepID=A0A6A3CAU2_HIBSY|nr:putative NDH-dependent cyclic electron flow 5 [Hibiscus syriacus]